MTKSKVLITLILCAAAYLPAQAQIDTTNIYGERKDSLSAAVATASGNGNFLSKSKDIRTEVITAAGLCKMACCNLAESFENSASVTVGYSDAVTGARQIRLLGQNGIYTQMLDENRPVMRGLSAPFGLNYIPGQWLESIQIAKGVTSVINGVESMTGQINMEHRKPTDEKPLYIQASVMDDTKADLNVISALQFDELKKWSTVIMGHIDGNFMEMDHNGDGFMDDPRQLQFNLSNRWLYYGSDGTQVRFGVRAIRDKRKGGQMSETDNPWQSDILNNNLGAYLKVGIPLNEANTSNVAMVLDYTYQDMDAAYGLEKIPSIPEGYYALRDPLSSALFRHSYDAGQHSAFVNLLYQNQDNDSHHFTLGLSDTFDHYNELLTNRAVVPHSVQTALNDFGAFGEYTFHAGEGFSMILGLRGDLYSTAGFRFSPRLTMKWSPSEWLTVRANGGRGLRYSSPIVDNFGVLSTSKTFVGDIYDHRLEDSWTLGGNATWYISGSTKNYISLDFFRTQFSEQLLVDNSANTISFYNLSDLDGGASYTNNWQADINFEPVPRFTVTLTGRFTDAHQTLRCQSDDIKPMTSRYKGVVNLQYATNLSKWIFDFTASVNGPCRVWDFMRGYKGMYADGYSQAYPLLYAQVTKRFRGFDIYAGGENLTGFRQKDPIINPETPGLDDTFDASCIWGPIMGVKLYAGIRITIWKTE